MAAEKKSPIARGAEMLGAIRDNIAQRRMRAKTAKAEKIRAEEQRAQELLRLQRQREDAQAKLDVLNSYPSPQPKPQSSAPQGRMARVVAGAGSLAAGATVGSTKVIVNNLADSAKNNTGTIWLFLAFIIAIVDGLPILGGTYAGFNDPVGYFLRENPLNQLFSGQTLLLSFFISYLGVRFVFALAKEKEVRPLPLIVLLLLLNSVIAIGGKYFLTFTISNIPLSEIIFWISLIAFLGVALGNFRISASDFIDDLIYFFFAFIWSVFFVLAIGWYNSSDFKPLLHFFFLLAFTSAYVHSKEEENDRAFYITAIVFVIGDLFGAALLSDIALLKFVPLLFAGTVYYVFAKEKNKLAIWLVVIFIALSFAFNASQANANEIGELNKNTQTQDFAKNYLSLFTSFFKDKIAEAIRFDGQVEQNQYESLGVYFSSLKAAQPRFYSNEPVIIWGLIRSKTYQDAVVIKPSCYEKKDGQIPLKGTTTPLKPFPIFQLEETDIECRFEAKVDDKGVPVFDPGSHSITLAAEYNFVTNAYQKAYFMDVERYRSYIREDIDPLTQLGIKDRSPKTVYTNGPVEIGMKIGTEPLLRVSNPPYAAPPVLYITLSNRQQIQDKDKKVITRWEGKIKDIRELVLLLPPGVRIPNPEKCQPAAPFKDYTETDCKTSCQNENEGGDFQLCLTGCTAGNTQDCKTQCERAREKCQKDCETLFRDAESSIVYNAYALDVSRIPADAKEHYQNIGGSEAERYRTFSCQIEPSPIALDNSPITIRYFRARAKYNYILENNVPIIVEQPSLVIASATSKINPTREGTGAFDPSSSAFVMINTPGTATGERENAYSSYAYQAAQSDGVDYFLLKAIVQQESGWNPLAERYEPKADDYSVGLGAVLTTTAKRIGCIPSTLSRDEAREQLKDSQTNLLCVARYIKKLAENPNAISKPPSLRNIAGGYNGGEGVMGKSDKDQNFAVWEDQNNAGYAPTRSYVNAVMSNYNTLIQKLDASRKIASVTITPTYDSSQRYVMVQWTSSAAYESSTGTSLYKVTRSATDGTISTVCEDIQAIGAAQNICFDRSVSGSATYTYRVAGYGSDGTEKFTQSASPYTTPQAIV